jgi:hypothetical protein
MTNQDISKKNGTEIEKGFPIQAKFLLVVIILGVLLVFFKIIGII